MADICWSLIWRSPNTGIGIGPTLIASATWVRLASWRLGTTLPLESMAPEPAAWWHSAQLRAKASCPCDRVTQPGSFGSGVAVGHKGATVGMVGPVLLVPVISGRALT